MSRSINRPKSIEAVKDRIANIEPRGPEDEAAFEYGAELQSVVDALEATNSDEDVVAAAENVSEESRLVWIDQ